MRYANFRSQAPGIYPRTGQDRHPYRALKNDLAPLKDVEGTSEAERIPVSHKRSQIFNQILTRFLPDNNLFVV